MVGQHAFKMWIEDPLWERIVSAAAERRIPAARLIREAVRAELGLDVAEPEGERVTRRRPLDGSSLRGGT